MRRCCPALSGEAPHACQLSLETLAARAAVSAASPHARASREPSANPRASSQGMAPQSEPETKSRQREMTQDNEEGRKGEELSKVCETFSLRVGLLFKGRSLSPYGSWLKYEYSLGHAFHYQKILLSHHLALHPCCNC